MSTSTSPPTPPTRIGLFCGSKAGASPSHILAARALAESMHAHSIHLVYGGGTTGLMGEVARTLVKLSGKDSVMGVIPSTLLGVERPGENPAEKKNNEKQSLLPRNWARRMGLSGGASAGGAGKGAEAPTKEETGKLLLDEEFGHVMIVDDLQIRKKKMMELVRDGGPGSGFVALSGGIGTIDELFEVVSWGGHGAHARGVCVLNVEGFWDGIIEWIRKGMEEEFVREKAEGRPILGNVKQAEDVVKWLKGYDEMRMKEREKKVIG
ncbi:MAG: hypothetical protein Q9171_006571 [Xanthocarpia ochracea]